MLQKTAQEHGLDPATALPEDVLLLQRDKDGNLLIEKEVSSAQARLLEDRGEI